MAFDLTHYMERWSREVDRALDRVLPPESAPPVTLTKAMRYSVFAGGKRVRPILCVAACEAVGGDPRLCLPTAAAIEMVHTYSLIHDDLPAMDNDDLRRGRPTCHKHFGAAAAILAGDGLLTEAFGVIARDKDLESGVRVRLVQGLAAAAGAGGMVAGQMKDVEQEGKEFSAADLDFIHLHKTAAMIENAVLAGAVIARASASQEADLRAYGRSAGLCFQVVDDVLNVTGGKDLGKGVGTDAARGKATYPALYGVDGSRQKARELLDQALAALDGFDGRAEPLRELARLIVMRDK